MWRKATTRARLLLPQWHTHIRASSTDAARPLRVGIIGAGRIGRVHAQGLQRTSADLRMISDPINDNAQVTAATFGIPKWTRSASEVIQDPEIDAVVICSPTDRHAEQIIEAAAHKKHIFCEKPIDLTLEVVNRAIAAVEAAGVKMMVGFNRRFDANFRRVRDAIVRGEVGDVNMLRITSRDPGAPPIEYVKVSGGMFRDMTIHDFDMARFLMSAAAEVRAGTDGAGTGADDANGVAAVTDEVDEVYAMAQSVNPAIAAAGDIDSAVVLLRFRSGAICYIENSREAAYGYDQRVEVLGSKGSAACDNNFANSVVVATARGLQYDVPLHFFLERYADAYVAEMEAFIAACRGGAETCVPVGGADGREALLLALAANKSLRENRPVKVDEVRERLA